MYSFAYKATKSRLGKRGSGGDASTLLKAVVSGVKTASLTMCDMVSCPSACLINRIVCFHTARPAGEKKGPFEVQADR